MPSKDPGAVGEPTSIGNDAEAVQPSNAHGLPPPSTEGMQKEPKELWTRMINKLEWFLEAEPEGPRRENIVACLHFVQEHGYVEEPNCLWAIDGVARCMDKFEYISIASRDRENYARHAFATCGVDIEVHQVSSIPASNYPVLHSPPRIPKATTHGTPAAGSCCIL